MSSEFITPIGKALACLDRDQLHVIVSFIWGEKTEREIALGLSELRNDGYSRDRVHRIRLTAQARMRREIEPLLNELAA